MEFTESQRRDMIVRCAEDCELALLSADTAERSGPVSFRLRCAAFHRKSASLFAAAAFTWANVEVIS
ncbi:hypothetical protein P3W23_14905 [Luteibacter sp. PPL554]